MTLRGMLYRALMRLAHRFDWHYAPKIGPLQDGSTQRWCQWCGFRQSYPKPKYRYDKQLRTILPNTNVCTQETQNDGKNGSVQSQG